MHLEHDGTLPLFVRMTSGKVHEVRVVKDAEHDYPALPPDSILTVDRGYMDYGILGRSAISFLAESFSFADFAPPLTASDIGECEHRRGSGRHRQS